MGIQLGARQSVMKKRNSRRATAIITCIALFVFPAVFQITASSMVRFKLRTHAHNNPTPVTEAHEVFLLKSTTTKQGKLRGPTPSQSHPARQVSCDRSHYNYDICSIHVATVLDPTASTFFIKHPITVQPNPTVTKIRPFPRKWENFTMSKTRELTITSGPPSPPCQVKHESPALVFSAGGYTGNFFHEFNDGFIPLFITINSVFNDQDNQEVVFVISKARDWWVNKYADLLHKFSKHPIINLDNDTSTHCFPSATLGLISHGFMTINSDSMPSSRSLKHFHDFLSKTYGTSNPSIPRGPDSRPRLVLMNRPYGVGRVLLNLEEVKLEVERVGFDVMVFEPKVETPLHKAFELINSSHAMVGIHGAALTHSLFLRPGSAFIQVVPLGAEWAAEVCFGNPARAMGLNYMEYRVGAEESSLIKKYGKEDMMVKDPVGFLKGKPWSKSVMDIYLKEQNVRLDLGRFRKYLKKAYKKAKQLMQNEG